MEKIGSVKQTSIFITIPIRTKILNQQCLTQKP